MRSLLLLVFLGLVSTAWSQSSAFPPTPTDYAEVWAQLETSPSAAVERAYPMVLDYFMINYDSAFALADRALAVDPLRLADTTAIRQRYLEGLVLNRKSDNKQAIEVLKPALAEADAVGHQRLIAEGKNMLGRPYADTGELQQAMQLFLDAAEQFATIGDTLQLIESRVFACRIIGYIDSWEIALEKLTALIPLAEGVNSGNTLANLYTFLGVAHGSLFYKFSNDWVTNSNTRDALAEKITFHFDEAARYNVLADGLARAAGNRFVQIATLMATIDNHQQHQQALGSVSINYAPILSRLEGLTKQLNANEFYNLFYFSAAKVANAQKNYATAIDYGHKMVALSKEMNNPKQAILGHFTIGDNYRDQHIYDKALQYLELYYTGQIGIIQEDNAQNLLELETRYQTSEKEKEIAGQQKDILELELKNAGITRQRNLVLIGGVSLLLFCLLAYRTNKVIKDRNDKKALTEALLYAQETERKRIARDLHDGIGQSLLLLIKQSERQEVSTQQNRKMIQATLEEVRAISRDLHPFQIEKFGLTSAIEDLLNKVEHSTDLYLTHELVDIDAAFASRDQIHIYRVIQEALNNIMKHSEATAAKLEINSLDKSVQLVLRDNGVGFTYDPDIPQTQSLGLRTMNERVTNMGGTFSVRKGEKSGTVLEMFIPKAPATVKG